VAFCAGIKVAYQFKKQLFEKINGEKINDDGFITLIMTVASSYNASFSRFPTLMDVSPGMNLYPRTRTLDLSRRTWHPVATSLRKGWNLLFAADGCSPEGIRPLFAEGRYLLSGSELYYAVPGNAAVPASFKALWRFSETEADEILQCPDVESSDYLSLAVSKGWNIVGHNYSEAIPFSFKNVTVLADGEIMTFDQAAQRGFLEPSLWDYEDEKYAPVRNGGAIVPARGYMLSANRALILRFHQ